MIRNPGKKLVGSENTTNLKRIRILRHPFLALKPRFLWKIVHVHVYYKSGCWPAKELLVVNALGWHCRVVCIECLVGANGCQVAVTQWRIGLLSFPSPYDNAKLRRDSLQIVFLVLLLSLLYAPIYKYYCRKVQLSKQPYWSKTSILNKETTQLQNKSEIEQIEKSLKGLLWPKVITFQTWNWKFDR